jgi:hypothetical protein
MSGQFNLRIQKIKGIIDPTVMAKLALPTFLTNTPIKTGNARKNTDAVKNEIQADYPYATRLDNGWSKQRPRGMSKPTIKFLQDYIKKNLGK